MSTSKDGDFYKGETWTISGTCKDALNKPMDLTSGNVQLHLSLNGVIVKTLTSPGEGTIKSPATLGAYSFVISPAQQTSFNLTDDAYAYAIWATLADGTVSVQNTGVIRLKTVV